MKVLSRDFTLREKLLLLVLTLIVIAFTYYKLVEEPVRTRTTQAKESIVNLETDLNIEQTRLQLMQKRQAALADIMASEHISKMESYNADHQERAFLNDLLLDAKEFNITFYDAEKTGNQVRRMFALRFETVDYAAAQEIIAALYNSEQRCLIEDLQISQKEKDSDLKAGAVTVSLTAVFYETMSGGTADAGLIIRD